MFMHAALQLQLLSIVELYWMTFNQAEFSTGWLLT